MIIQSGVGTLIVCAKFESECMKLWNDWNVFVVSKERIVLPLTWTRKSLKRMRMEFMWYTIPKKFTSNKQSVFGWGLEKYYSGNDCGTKFSLSSIYLGLRSSDRILRLFQCHVLLRRTSKPPTIAISVGEMYFFCTRAWSHHIQWPIFIFGAHPLFSC